MKRQRNTHSHHLHPSSHHSTSYMYTGGQVLANVLALEVHLDSTVFRHLRLGMSVVSSVVPSLKRALPRPLARPRTMDVQRPLQQRLESRRQAGRLSQ